MGEVFCFYGVLWIVGVDIIFEVCEVVYCDCLGIYDDYYIVDFCNFIDDVCEDIDGWIVNCFMFVVVLGFDDIFVFVFFEVFCFV